MRLKLELEVSCGAFRNFGPVLIFGHFLDRPNFCKRRLQKGVEMGSNGGGQIGVKKGSNRGQIGPTNITAPLKIT